MARLDQLLEPQRSHIANFSFSRLKRRHGFAGRLWDNEEYPSSPQSGFAVGERRVQPVVLAGNSGRKNPESLQGTVSHYSLF